MKTTNPQSPGSKTCLATMCLCGLLFTATAIPAEPAHASRPDSLRSIYASIRPQLARNPFHRQIYLDSRERHRSVEGDIFALIFQPFGAFSAALVKPANWCEILLLHLNTKYCRATGAPAQARLTMIIGRKYDQPTEQAHRLILAYQVREREKDYLQVALNADAGPLGTRDFRIVLEAIPLEDRKTFMHLSYSYSYGLTARLGMQAYFNTAGRNKVGFTSVGASSTDNSALVGGIRGLIERNIMRYYLAIEVFMKSLQMEGSTRFEARLRDWFAATEQYARQLHELEESEYLALKREEYRASSTDEELK